MKILFEGTGVGEDIYSHYRESLDGYVAELQGVVRDGAYDEPESSINLPSDEGMLSAVKHLAKEKASNTNYIIVVGIGGSNLGAKAVFDALKPSREGALRQMLFFETLDTHRLEVLRSLIEHADSAEDFIICVISKSGNTTETLLGADLLFDVVQERFGSKGADRFVVITDEESKLHEKALGEGVATLTLPKPVGGRFSVFSAAGLFPLACAGVDIEALLRGAESARGAALEDGGGAALRSASFLAHFYREGCAIHDFFIFDESLESLGSWYRQLLAESIGKKENNNGEEVRTGIAPTISIGSRDLHSVAQLTLGGPRNKTTTFVTRPRAQDSHIRISKEGFFSSHIPELSGRTAHDVREALYGGAKAAYREEGLPFIEVQFEKEEDEFEIGEFMQWKMLEIMLLARILNINAFDQPSVELYKKETRRLLEN